MQFSSQTLQQNTGAVITAVVNALIREAAPTVIHFSALRGGVDGGCAYLHSYDDPSSF